MTSRDSDRAFAAVPTLSYIDPSDAEMRAVITAA